MVTKLACGNVTVRLRRISSDHTRVRYVFAIPDTRYISARQQTIGDQHRPERWNLKKKPIDGFARVGKAGVDNMPGLDCTSQDKMNKNKNK